MGVDASLFDVASAIEAARSFRLSTGIECYVIDQAGLLLDRSGDQVRPSVSDGVLKCQYCRTLQRITGRFTDCQQVHLHGANQSHRFGGKYLYFCPLSLLHLTSPIIVDGVVKASFVAGPVMLVDPNDYYETEVQGVYSLPDTQMAKLKASLNRITSVTPPQARALADQLLYTASWVSGSNVQKLIDEEARLSQQARINEYIGHIQTMGGGDGETYPLELEDQLIACLSQGNKAGAQKLLDEYLARLHVANGGELSTMKARTLELVVLLSRAAIRGGADAESVFGLNFQALREIHTFRTVEQIEHWLSMIISRFNSFVLDVQQAQNRDVIVKAIHFIQTHYHSDLTLGQVAQAVCLSPTYFSKLFKLKTGETFKHHLNKVRIQHSKTLLINTNHSLVDIAARTGFEEQSYFTRVFKTLVGVSPGRYRKTYGLLPSETEEIHE